MAQVIDLQPNYFHSTESQAEQLGEKTNETENARLSLNSAVSARVLGGLTFILITASTVTQIAYHSSGPNSAFFQKLVKIFSVDLELNVPNFFSMLMLLFSSLLTAFIAIQKRKQKDSYVWHWTILSVGFLLMAFDEIGSAHEKLVEPMQAFLGKENLSIFYFAWVVPGILLVLFLAFVFLKFWLNLSAKTRFAFLVAGLFYIGGAVGMELIGGRHFELYGKDNLTYILLTTIEESLEMTGVIVFIWALLGYIKETYKKVEVHLL